MRHYKTSVNSYQGSQKLKDVKIKEMQEAREKVGLERDPDCRIGEKSDWNKLNKCMININYN